MKKSFRQKLHDKILSEGRLSYGSMCQFAVEEGYKVDTATRRLRELAEDELIHLEWATSKRNTRYISASTAEKVVIQKKPTYQIVIKDGQPVAVAV